MKLKLIKYILINQTKYIGLYLGIIILIITNSNNKLQLEENLNQYLINEYKEEVYLINNNGIIKYYVLDEVLLDIKYNDYVEDENRILVSKYGKPIILAEVIEEKLIKINKILTTSYFKLNSCKRRLSLFNSKIHIQPNDIQSSYFTFSPIFNIIDICSFDNIKQQEKIDSLKAEELSNQMLFSLFESNRVHKNEMIYESIKIEEYEDEQYYYFKYVIKSLKDIVGVY